MKPYEVDGGDYAANKTDAELCEELSNYWDEDADAPQYFVDEAVKRGLLYETEDPTGYRHPYYEFTQKGLACSE